MIIVDVKIKCDHPCCSATEMLFAIESFYCKALHLPEGWTQFWYDSKDGTVKEDYCPKHTKK